MSHEEIISFGKNQRRIRGRRVEIFVQNINKEKAMRDWGFTWVVTFHQDLYRQLNWFHGLGWWAEFVDRTTNGLGWVKIVPINY
jgi:hypothetical protein